MQSISESRENVSQFINAQYLNFKQIEKYLFSQKLWETTCYFNLD